MAASRHRLPPPLRSKGVGRLRLGSRYGEGIVEATRTVRDHPLRAALAGLAVAAAVATTALVVTALEGVERAAQRASARAFGTDSFVIARVFGSDLGRRELAAKLERNQPIRRNDVRFLERWSGDRVLYAPAAQTVADVSFAGRTFESAAINGTTATLTTLRDLGIERGRFIGDFEDRAAALVTVLGASVTEELFPGIDPLGRKVRIAGRGFTVVGVLAAQGTAGGTTLDRYAYMPLAAFERTFGAPESLQVFARATDTARAEAAEDIARATMRARRRLRPGEPDTFDLLTPEAGRDFVASITTSISAAGPPISAMALLAAIVVVTNTILVSIAQRTREIGIRRSVGAARRHIVLEVVVEGVIISLVGGAAGLAGAAGILAAANVALDFDATLQVSTALGSMLAAALSGVLASWYPARRAAAINVVRALHED